MDKYQGCALIAINNKGQILLHLRDDKPSIPFQNMWQLPGGRVEDGEAPEDAMKREISEEWDGYNLTNYSFFRITPSGSYDNNIFTVNINIDPKNINLLEGQEIKWFDIYDAAQMKLADTDNITLQSYIDKYL